MIKTWINTNILYIIIGVVTLLLSYIAYQTIDGLVKDVKIGDLEHDKVILQQEGLHKTSEAKATGTTELFNVIKPNHKRIIYDEVNTTIGKHSIFIK